jgi:hypothetical protein
MKVLKDRTLPVPWDPAKPSPSKLIGATALSNPGFLIEVRNRRGCRELTHCPAIGLRRLIGVAHIRY